MIKTMWVTAYHCQWDSRRITTGEILYYTKEEALEAADTSSTFLGVFPVEVHKTADFPKIISKFVFGRKVVDSL